MLKTATPVLTFEPDGHRYAIRGQTVPSVTQVLASQGILSVTGIAEAHLFWAGTLGTAVHQAVLFHLQGDLDEDTLDPLVVPYVAAFRTFIADTGYAPILELVEQPLCDEQLWFAGTPDLPGEFHGGRRCVIDLKSGVPRPGFGPQTAAYQHLLRAVGFVCAERMSLRLLKDGRYRLIPYHTDPKHRADWAQFQAALSNYAFRREWGLL